MDNNSLIPEGFKDHVDFNTNVEHEYKNKIIDYFISNGFDLVKTPLVEFYKKNGNNYFFIESKKNERRLFFRDDITPQIIRIASSRFRSKKRPIKLCYYGEVIRKKGTMLRPERQFLQIGSEIIGSKSVSADIEIITLAYQSLAKIGITNITLELTSKIFLDEILTKIKDINSLKKLKNFIKQKDIKNSLTLINNKKDKVYLENLFKLTGNSNKLNNKINNLAFSEIAKKEIENIKKISKSINLKTNDQITYDFTEFDNKNYHDGIKFTFFAKNIRGEIASGGRYKINTDLQQETAVGFTCFMDTVLRASSFENMSKKILIPFETEEIVKENLMKKNYIIYSFFENTDDISDIRLFAKKYSCTHIYENNKIKEI
ncbi:ATP phosphoribosyltransferase regulatory subunit [Alphaproteobacteria bacterium]|nr:ATP phosphoribosyltransferase regulatory subunit [Alphaproteobacteria bacterium]